MHLSQYLCLVVAIPLAGCSATRQGYAPCQGSVDYSTLTRVVSDSRKFSIVLPKGAHERDVMCIDSECGLICVGDWSVEYDIGLYNYHDAWTDSLFFEPSQGSVVVDRRIETVNGARMIYKLTRTIGDSAQNDDARGRYRAVAKFAGDVGLLLMVSGLTTQDLPTVLSAFQSVRLAEARSNKR